MINKLALIALCFLCAACTTYPHDDGRVDYLKTIENNSAGDKQFAGVYHQFEFRATVLNRTMVNAIHERMRKFYAWDEEMASEKLNERTAKMEKETTLWMSFFTSNRKNDNLANKQTIWKIYLFADGQRYEGRARKANKNMSEAQAIFPYHDRWSTAYYVDFPVPTYQVEGAKLKLVVTGPLGRREVEFK